MEIEHLAFSNISMDAAQVVCLHSFLNCIVPKVCRSQTVSFLNYVVPQIERFPCF